MSAPSDPSDRAKQAAWAAAEAEIAEHFKAGMRDVDALLAAAHDPALGVDRSVCLRDVLEFLELSGASHAAMRVERRFAGETESDA